MYNGRRAQIGDRQKELKFGADGQPADSNASVNKITMESKSNKSNSEFAPIESASGAVSRLPYSLKTYDPPSLEAAQK